MYLISKNWLNKWRIYTQYKRVKRSYTSTHYTMESLQSLKPGPITNETLLKPYHKYLRDDREDEPLNQIIKNKMRERYDYKLASREMWELLFKKYGGFEIKKFKDPDPSNRKYLIKAQAVAILQ